MAKKQKKSGHQLRHEILSSIKSWISPQYPTMRCVFKRKLCFHFRNEAEINTVLEFAKSYSEKLKELGYKQIPIRGYKCHCVYWHLTHLETFDPKKPFIFREPKGFFD